MKPIPWRRRSEIIYDADARDQLYKYIAEFEAGDIFVNPDDVHEDLSNVAPDDKGECNSYPPSVRGLSPSSLLVASS